MQTKIREELEYIENESLINRLNNYISKVDSQWKKRIKPSNKLTITKLAKLVKMEDERLKLPNSFIEFIEAAGENDGGLLSKTLRGDFSVSSLIEFYEGGYDEGHMLDDYLEDSYEEEPFLDGNLFEFLIDEVGIGYQILLDDKNYGKIYYEDTCFISSSFEKLLFQCAIRRYEEKYFKINVTFGSSINSLRNSDQKCERIKLFNIMDKICYKNNLKKAWFSDDCFYCAYSDTISIFLFLRQLIGGKTYIVGRIYGNYENEVEVLLNEFLPKIGGKIQKVYKKQDNLIL